jgi:Ca2+-binding EF-hand superfamily protein
MWNVFRSLSPASVRPARVFWSLRQTPQPEKESSMTVSSVGSSSLTQQLLQLQQSMFTSADADSDGSLSLSEFQAIGQNVQGGGQRPPPPPMGGSSSAGANFSGDTLRSLMSVQMLGSDSGSIISSADSDADGLLSADEISTALSANAPDDAKGLGLEGKMASDMISALDSDDDGSLSSDEIAAGLTTASTIQSAMQGMQGAGGPPPGPPPGGGGGGGGGGGSTSATGSSGVFETLDTNQDGTVSAAELAAADTEDTDAASAAKDLIAASDTDGDGSLSGFEFADMLDAAKSSSTTTAATDSTSSLSSLLSSSTLASDLMAKLLAQLDSALASKSGSTSTVSATA